MCFVGLFTTTCTTCSSQVIRCGMTTRSACMLFLITANLSFIISLVIHYPAFCLASDNDCARHVLLYSVESGIQKTANNTSMVVIHVFSLTQSLPLCHHQQDNLPAYCRTMSPISTLSLACNCFTESNGMFLQISQLLLSLC
jgi:hypothetical protein